MSWINGDEGELDALATYLEAVQVFLRQQGDTSHDHLSGFVGPEVAQRAVPSATCDMVWCAERAGSWLFSGYT